MTQASFVATKGILAMIERYGLATLCLIGLLSHGSSARAEEATATSAAAELLFLQARTLMKEHRYEDACSAFENSERLEPASGTLLNLGVCREAQGRTASAFRSYRAGLALSQAEQNRAAESLARERLAALDPRLCRIALSIRWPRPGLVVRLDGAAVAPTSWGKPEPIDPGAHRIESSGPDQESWSTTIDIEGAGAVQTLVVESPRAGPAKTGTQAGLVAPARTSRKQPELRPPPARRSAQPERWPLVLSSSVAVTGVFGVAYFGVLATKEWERRNEHCPGDKCDRFALQAYDSAQRYARAANIAGGMAVLGGVTAISLLVFRSRVATSASSRPSVRLESSGANIELAGDF
jgi:hypothetical protein